MKCNECGYMKNIELRFLTQAFYQKYTSVIYPEICAKDGRPYAILLVKIDSNTFAIPLRTNIQHKYCYKFKNTNRNTNSSTGLDFSKAVIVNELKYIDFNTTATIDNKEYLEISNKHFFIEKKFKEFLDKYKKVINDPVKYSYEYNLLNKYSTLKYFHIEIGLK